MDQPNFENFKSVVKTTTLNNKEEFKKAIKSSRLQWLTPVQAIEIYNQIATELDVTPSIIHPHLISDALYNPIKDILDYDSNSGVFTRICNCVYSIGQTVNTCSIPFMIVMFIALCDCNKFIAPKVTDELIVIFEKAYHKQINPYSFKGHIMNLMSNN